MKNCIFIIMILICAGALLQSQSLTITVKNPSLQIRQAETVTLDLHGLYQSHPEMIGKNIAIVESSKELVHQFVDENFDGIPDILIFQSSFKPLERKKFSLRATSKSGIPFGTVVDGRFVLPRQDFAWENDRIAFRVYGSSIAGDVRNGIDVWNKRVRYPIIEKWYQGEEQVPKRSYHEDRGEGADYFSVGKSLGCGSTGILWKGNLVQPGLFSHYRIIANGPLRVSFELYYPALKLDTIEILVIKRITLDAGSNLNKIEEQYVSNVPVDDLVVAAGLAKRKNTAVEHDAKQGWMTLWGSTTADTAVGYLGTAVIMDRQYPLVPSEDSVHWLLTAVLGKKTSMTYYAGAGWTLSGDFSTGMDWTGYVERCTELLKQPLQVTVSKK